MPRIIREIFDAIVLALVIFFLISVSVQNFRVSGNSMDASLQDGEYLLVSKLNYLRIDMQRLSELIPFWDVEEPREVFAFSSPHRGDVIVFDPPFKTNQDFVKRIVGLPGEQVELKNGRVYIDGRVLREPHTTSCKPPRGEYCNVKLKEREYFVMGDNRGASNDSRDWGPVPLENIIGKVWVIYWPFSDFGFLPGPGD